MNELPVCFRNELPEGVRRTCPWCGKLIITNDATLTMFHEVPACNRFTAEATATGGAPQAVHLVRRS